VSRLALIAEISESLLECSDDEVRVVAAVLRRLAKGRDAYGPLDLASDGRDWRDELAEELQDAVVYAAIRETAAHVRRETERDEMVRPAGKRRR